MGVCKNANITNCSPPAGYNRWRLCRWGAKKLGAGRRLEAQTPTVNASAAVAGSDLVAPMTLAGVLVALLVLLYVIFSRRFNYKPISQHTRTREHIEKKAPTFLKDGESN